MSSGQLEIIFKLQKIESELQNFLSIKALAFLKKKTIFDLLN
jgi:hypothetical protein